MTPTPYYSSNGVDLYLGDCREVLPALVEAADGPIAAGAVGDPPYEETQAAWDKWPTGWVEAVSLALPADASFWCFGSLRMHFAHHDEFPAAGWRIGQDRHDLYDLDALIWEKKNGTGPGSRDRLIKVHEIAVHWWRGRWNEIPHQWDRDKNYGPDKGLVRREVVAGHHQRSRRKTSYQDDGTRQPRSVLHIKSPSVRLVGRHQDEKPLAAVLPLIQECTREGETVLDATAGVATVGVGARMLRRRAILIEEDEAIAETGARRLAEVDEPESAEGELVAAAVAGDQLAMDLVTA